MALLFVDGFDHYDNIRLKWVVSNSFDNPNFVLGRFGGQALAKQFQNSAGSIRHTLQEQQSSIIVGVALYTSNQQFPADDLLTFRDSNGTVILTLTMVRDGVDPTLGHLEVTKPGQDLVTSVDQFPEWGFQEWHYIQVKYNPNKTSGLVEVKLEDGLTVYIANGRTTEEGDNDVQSVQIMGNATNSPLYLLDDFYIANEEGGENNDFLGQMRISLGTANTIPPPGFLHKESAGSTGAITQELMDVDSTVSLGVIGAFDDYHMTPICAYLSRSFLSTIYAIQMVTGVAKDNTGVIKYQHILNTTDDGPDITPGTLNESIDTRGMFCEPQMYNNDPIDSGAWTSSKIDALHIGFRLTAREGGA